jgi:hypothetical protein
MKTRLNLTVDNEVVRRARKVAAAQSVSLSQMVEDYLVKVSAPKDIEPLHIRLLSTLQSKKNLPVNNRELWALYGDERKKKYGF